MGPSGNNRALVALAGNPNTGKSTIFNALTGLHQHTGNWPGKTVALSTGHYIHRQKRITLVDLPGTYSLLSNSQEEEIARDFLCFSNPAVVIVVVDATCIERNLNLVLQVIEATPNVVVCVNLVDEAQRKGIKIDLAQLSQDLGAPVVGTIARSGKGLTQLKDVVNNIIDGEISPSPQPIIYDEGLESILNDLERNLSALSPGRITPRWVALRLLDGDLGLIENIRCHLGDTCKVKEFDRIVESVRCLSDDYSKSIRDRIVSTIYGRAEYIASRAVTLRKGRKKGLEEVLDDLLTSKVVGFPAMLALFGLLLWITVSGANYPSRLLSGILFSLQDRLVDLARYSTIPKWLHEILLLGVYRTVSWVVSVMLPPMAIFFPLFTILEDLGYLPRIAFNLDNFFKRAGAHGKQALTMSMGFGCNAVGVMACRIIDSPRERLIAILTNNFVPCNGRFPTLITMASLVAANGLVSHDRISLAALIVIAAILIGTGVTFVVSWGLSKTVLRGVPSFFTLELPPFRKPQIGKIIVRSVFDRTLFVLWRAVTIAAPAGAISWLMANIQIGGASLLAHLATRLDPLGHIMGLDGFILAAFLLGLPANETVIPIMLMGYLSNNMMVEAGDLNSLRNILSANGWTWVTAMNMMLFSLFHYPCGTTLSTIYKETGSLRWTLLSAIIPTGIGIILCSAIAQAARWFG